MQLTDADTHDFSYTALLVVMNHQKAIDPADIADVDEGKRPP